MPHDPIEPWRKWLLCGGGSSLPVAVGGSPGVLWSNMVGPPSWPLVRGGQEKVYHQFFHSSPGRVEERGKQVFIPTGRSWDMETSRRKGLSLVLGEMLKLIAAGAWTFSFCSVHFQLS